MASFFQNLNPFGAGDDEPAEEGGDGEAFLEEFGSPVGSPGAFGGDDGDVEELIEGLGRVRIETEDEQIARLQARIDAIKVERDVLFQEKKRLPLTQKRERGRIEKARTELSKELRELSKRKAALERGETPRPSPAAPRVPRRRRGPAQRTPPPARGGRLGKADDDEQEKFRVAKLALANEWIGFQNDFFRLNLGELPAQPTQRRRESNTAFLLRYRKFLDGLADRVGDASDAEIAARADAEEQARIAEERDRAEEQAGLRREAEARARREAAARQEERDRRRDLAQRRAALQQAVGDNDDAAAGLDEEFEDQSEDDESELVNAADNQDELEEDLDENDRDVRLTVKIPSGAAFYTIGDDTRRASANDFVRDTFGADNDLFAWDATLDRDGNYTFTLAQSIAGVKFASEALVAKLFRAWATKGQADADFGRSNASLHARYWTDSVVPWLTAIGLQLRKAQLANAAKEAQDADDDYPYNQQLEQAFNFFLDIANFVVVKAVTGNEATPRDDLPKGSTQAQGPRARSRFDKYELYKLDPSIAATLGLPDQTVTRNQLLRFDRRLLKAQGGDQKDRTRRDKNAGTFSAVSAPVVKIIATYQAGDGEVKTFNSNGKRLFDIRFDSATQSYKPSGVDFVGLVTDKFPNSTVANVAEGRRSQQSFESFVQRAFALPLLDALYFDDLREIAVRTEVEGRVRDFPVDAFSLQTVGDGFPSAYVNKLGFTPLFFEPFEGRAGTLLNGVEFEPRDEVSVFLPDTNREGKRRRSMLVAPTLDGIVDQNQFRANLDDIEQRGGAGATNPIDVLGNTPAGAGDAPVDAYIGADERLAGQLTFAATLQQIANINVLWSAERVDDTQPVRPTGKRVEIAHQIIALSLFRDVNFGPDVDGSIENQVSLFQRYGQRPSAEFLDDSNEIEPVYFRSDAKPRTGKSGARANTSAKKKKSQKTKSTGAQTTKTALGFPRPRFLLGTMSKAILGEKARKFEIGTFQRYMKGKEPYGKALAAKLDNPNERRRTVLVPTDRAIQRFLDSATFERATVGMSEDETNKYIIDTFLYHTLSGEYDMAELFKRQSLDDGTQIPTELVDANDVPVIMNLRVANYSRVGEIVIDEQDKRLLRRIRISEPRKAKNGAYYIVDGVADISAALKRSRKFAARRRRTSRYDSPASPVKLPADISESVIEDIYGVDDLEASDSDSHEYIEVDEDRQDAPRARLPQAPPQLFPPPPLGSSAKANGRRSHKKSGAHHNKHQKKQQRSTAEYIAALSKQGTTQRIQSRVTSAQNACSKLLVKSRAEAQRINEREFAPWREFLERTGVLARIDERASDATAFDREPLHIMAPTPAAIKASKIDLGRASHELAEAHVGIGRYQSPYNASRTNTTPISGMELHQLMQHTEPIVLDTLHAERTLHHMPSDLTRGAAKKPAHHQQIYLEDVQFREPSYVYKPSSAQPVHVHFVNRVFHADLATKKSAAAPAPTSRKTTTSTRKSVPSSAGAKWQEAVQLTAASLANARTDKKYSEHVRLLDTTLSSLGGSDAVTAEVSTSDIKAHMNKLKGAVARNRNISSLTKSEAHKALGEIRGRFPAW